MAVPFMRRVGHGIVFLWQAVDTGRRFVINSFFIDCDTVLLLVYSRRIRSKSKRQL